MNELLDIARKVIHPNATCKDDHDLVASPLAAPSTPKGAVGSDQGQLSTLQLLYQCLQQSICCAHGVDPKTKLKPAAINLPGTLS